MNEIEKKAWYIRQAIWIRNLENEILASEENFNTYSEDDKEMLQYDHNKLINALTKQLNLVKQQLINF